MRFQSYFALALIVTVTLVSQFNSYAQVIYVAPTGNATNIASATSWANALSGTALQGALATAPSGTTFLLAGGEYKPTNGIGPTSRLISFFIPRGVQVFGGYVGDVSNPNQRTITPYSSTTFSGNIGSLTNNTDNSYHVVQFQNADNDTKLDGVVITSGNADGGNSDFHGGGIYNGLYNSIDNLSQPTITNCLITQNTATSYGGGMYNDASGGKRSLPLLINCQFKENSAYSGGGMFNFGNGGNSSPTLINCTFTENRAAYGGGAIFNNGALTGRSGPALTNCSFIKNTAESRGGAIYNNGYNNEYSKNCQFSQNTSELGGAIYNDGPVGNVFFRNCSFSQNNAVSGGAFYNDGSTSGGINSPVLYNCIVYDNGDTFNKENGVNVIASYSLFNSNISGYSGLNNLTCISQDLI